MKRKQKIAVSILLCLAMIFTMMPVYSSAKLMDTQDTQDPQDPLVSQNPQDSGEFAVLEIPIYKDVVVDQGNPGKTTFSVQVSSETMPADTQYTIKHKTVDTNGAGSYEGVLEISIPTQNDFWNMTEGFIVRETDDGEEGWTYDETEWIVIPYMKQVNVGTAVNQPITQIGYAIYGREDEIDWRNYEGSRDGLYFTNVYDLPGGGEPDPTDVKISIPYTKAVTVLEGSAAPAKKFTLELGEVSPSVIDGCKITGNIISTDGPGVYTGTLTIAPKDDDVLHALMNGFTVTEKNDSSDTWNCDTTEWFITLAENKLGGLSVAIYNLTEGDKPGSSKSHEEMTFENIYNPPSGDPPTTPGPKGDKVTITYDPNGGSVEDPVETVEKGKTVTLTKTASRDSWSFLGWFETKDSTERLLSIKPETDVTVYAHWKQTDVPDILNGTDHTNYVIGYEDGTIRPLNEITRAEVTMIFYRLLKDEIREANFTSENSFDDVSPTSWYNDAVSTMGKIGIIKGRGDSTFDPNAPITRAEYAAICSRFDTSEVLELASFSDISGNWAEDYIKHAVAIGWVKGYSDNTFRPNQKITRAESMTMTNRVLQRLPENVGDLLPEMKTFSDNMDPNAWYYLAVQEASNSHEYEMKANGHEKWTVVL